MSLKTVWIGACFVCLAFAQHSALGSGEATADDQASSSERSSIIRISSNLVTVPVSVTDAEGHAVGDLDVQDFLVEEDGRPESISKMTDAGRSPLRLALVFDLSGSVNSRFEFEQQAAIRFLEKVWKPGDTVSIVSFNECPRIQLQTSERLSDAMKVLLTLEPTERPTSFFDAVVMSARILRQSAGLETRQAIITLSDGEDNRSKNDLWETLNQIQRADTAFYSINPGGSSIRLNEISLKAQADMASLARETGGSAFVSDKASDLENFFSKIAAELRAQYLLSYYSANPRTDGAYRRISVSIPGRKDLRIQTRRGYYAYPK